MHDWIFAHRGNWHPNLPPNSSDALSKAFLNGFAVETDVRDSQGELVISHDPCSNPEAQRFNQLFSNNQRIAINIKSDGLSGLLAMHIEQILQSNSFIFDCSFPELLRYKKVGIPHAMRLSEYEKGFPWTPNYIWLDAFESDWWIEDSYTLDLIKKIPAVVVSPELHKRPHHEVWNKVKTLRKSGVNVSVCTDFPETLAQELA
jgi:hypothetical protein